MAAPNEGDAFNLDLYEREECLGKGSFGTVFK